MIMNTVQIKIEVLEVKGWTLAALSDELGVHHMTVRRWRSGDRSPENAKTVLMALDTLIRRKRIPKQRRDAPGSRRGGSRLTSRLPSATT